MKRVICSDRLDADFNEELSFDGKKIHIPTRYIKKSGRPIFLKIKDTEGSVLLEPTYLSEYGHDELFRYLPSWGLKIVKNIASVPDVWVVDYIET